VYVSALPLTPGGKTDMEAVAALCARHAGAPAETVEHDHNVTQVRVAGIWAHVLGRQGIPAGADFFEAGGSSLRAAHLLARVQAEFRKGISMEEFLVRPTIAGLSLLLDAKPSTPAPHGYLVRKGGAKPALFIMPGHGGIMTAYTATMPHYSGSRPIYGFQSPGLLGQEEGATIGKIAAAHVKMIRSLQPSGPYHILGYCFGGLVAFEAARQLHAEGATIGMLGVIHLNLYEMPLAPCRFNIASSIIPMALNFSRLPGEFLQIDRQEKILSLQRIYYRLRRRGTLAPDATAPKTSELRLWESHDAAWNGYVPRAFPGVVTLLRPQRLPMLQPDPTLGWGKIAGQQVEVRIVPGSGIHGQSLKNRNAKGTAKVIEAAIAQWERALLTR
jgi:thioesterase domain-containing protein